MIMIKINKENKLKKDDDKEVKKIKEEKHHFWKKGYMYLYALSFLVRIQF